MQLIHATKRLARFLVCGVLFAALPLMADTEELDGYTWSYRIIGDTAKIYNNASVAISPKPTGPVTIPSILGSKPVTSIGGYAFYGCKGLTSVTIPNSVTNLEDCAFSYCNGLTGITIPNSVTNIGKTAFFGCTGLTNVVIGNGVTSIDSYVFGGCNGLRSFVVASGNACYKAVSGLLLTKDGKTLVSVPGGLTSVTIPDGVTSIGKSAFYYCSGLMNVTIPDGVTNIEDSAFESCYGLTSVTIPDSVTSIGDSAFESCYGLTSVTIPDSVTSIGDGAFALCEGVKSFEVASGNVNYKFVSGLLLTRDGKTLVAALGELTSVTIPDSVTCIGKKSFFGCYDLTSVTIPDSVTWIGDYAFEGCGGLTNVIIPDNVTSVGRYAFRYCDGLTNVTIGNCVTNIGNYAFSACWGLTNVVIPDSVTSIGNWTFEECYGLASVTIGNGVTRIGNGVFEFCYSLTNVTIPDSVTSIGNSAFYDCSDLTSVTIGNGVTWIGDGAFVFCHNLTYVIFTGDAPRVADWAFDYVNSNCCVYVSRNSGGWDVDIPGVWQGLQIRYIDDVSICTVAFDLGEHGTRIGGGLEVQTVIGNGDAVAPEVVADPGWIFVGWDKAFRAVASDMTVKAQWRQAVHADVWGEWSVPEGTDYTMPESVLSLTELSCVVWRARDAYVKAGVKTEVPPSEGAIVLSLGAVAVPDSLFDGCEPMKTDVEHGVEVWRMRVFEDADTSSLVGVVGSASFKIADVPSYRDDLWVREVYGSPPSWLDGEGEEKWFAIRSRKRIGWFVTLVPQSKWGTYCATQTGNAKATRGEEPPQLSVTGIEVDPFTAIHKVSVQSAEEGTTWILGADSLGATNWTYSGLALQPCGISSAGAYSDSSNQFFKAVFSPTAADSDGDGIPDALEENVYGTNPNKADSSGDGLSDWDKLFRYGLNPLAKDTDEDGLDDGEEIMAGSDPNVPAAVGTQSAVQTSIRYYYDEDDRLVGTYIGQGAGRSRITLSPAGNSMEIQKEGK